MVKKGIDCTNQNRKKHTLICCTGKGIVSWLDVK